MKKKYIWLFAENHGDTADNNSFYFWQHVVNIKDDIDKYFLLTRNKKIKNFTKPSPPGKRNIFCGKIPSNITEYTFPRTFILSLWEERMWFLTNWGF